MKARAERAGGALTKKDFRYKVATCKKEAKKTIHWHRMIACANPDRAAECKELGGEALELARIFFGHPQERKMKTKKHN